MAITREEYIQWADLTINFAEDAILDKEADKARQKYGELTVGLTVGVVAHDWKDYDNHSREVCKRIKELDATIMHYFPAYHGFPHGELDTIVTIVSKEEMTREFAEILADLVVNLGA